MIKKLKNNSLKELKLARLVSFFALFLLGTFSNFSYSQVNCTDDTPFYTVDLTGDPNGVFVTPNVRRDGECCGGGGNQTNCIEFSITLDEDAAGIQFQVVSGADPGGALYYQIDCEGVPVASGSADVCLSGVGPHLISYCKVGNNQNEYSITSIPAPTVVDDVSLTLDGVCNQELSVEGLDEGSIYWNSISPGFTGEYNNYLSDPVNGTTGTVGAAYFASSTVELTPDENAPASILYEVCGNPEATCFTEEFCETIEVTIFPALGGEITPQEPAICFGGTETTLTANPLGGSPPHTYEWSTGETTQSVDINAPGEYSVIITDAIDCAIAYDTVTVIEFSEEITADAGDDIVACQAPVPTINLSGVVTGTTTGIWSNGGGTFSDETDLNATYTPSATEMAAGSVSLILSTTNNGTCPGDSDTVEILLPPFLSDVNTVVQDMSCFGVCDGFITAQPVGGLPPYTYSWAEDGTDIGQTTQTASNLCAGNYEVTVTDAAGCEFIQTATVNEPDELEGEVVTEDVSCVGQCDGEVEVINVSGGIAPYEYTLNDGNEQVSNTFDGLCIGNKTIEIIDANDCSVAILAVIGQPDLLELNLVEVVDETCGSSNGSINVSASGGTTPYEYTLGGTTQASGTFDGLTAGNYTIEVADANNCTETINVPVEGVPEPTAFVDDQTNLTCFNSNNGTVLIGTTNAVAPVQYSLNGGANQTSNSFTGLAAGTYTVEITDANDCNASVEFTITQPDQLAFTHTTTAASCTDLCDGEVTITAVGGTGPYQYSSNNGLTYSTDNVLTGLCPGAITIELAVQDANSCLVNSTTTIPNPDPVEATFDLTDPLCYGTCDGEIQVNATGGTGTYEYAIDSADHQASNVFEDLCSGEYEISVIDGNNCEFIDNPELVDPPEIELTEISMTPSNCLSNNGGIEVVGDGGTEPYEYSIYSPGVVDSPFQSDGEFSNLQGGGYTITVRDALGCEASSFFGINDIEMEGELIEKTHATCFGLADGTAEVSNVDGIGVEPIQYELDNSGVGQTNGNFSDLAAGQHMVTLYDDGLCVYNVIFEITEPDPIEFDIVIEDVVCNGGSSGSILFTNQTGGTGDYQYSIDGATLHDSPLFENLAAGSYFAIVQDENNCSAFKQAPVRQPDPVTFQSNLTDLTCFENNTGFIQLIGEGGTGTNYEYSINNGATFQTNRNFAPLAAGVYDVVVRDEVGCSVSGSVELFQPEPLTAIYAISDALCNGACNGEIEITPDGGTTPYRYSIDDGNTFTTNNEITGICASDFTVIIRDSNGCTINADQTVSEPDPVTLTSTMVPSTCGNDNGEIIITANGGTPNYTYSIDEGQTFEISGEFDGLGAGTYDLVVSDENNCRATDRETIADQPAPELISITRTHPLCNGDANGELLVNTDGGTGDFTYSINGNPPQDENLFTGLSAGDYTITIEDENGCTATGDRTLIDPPVLTFTSSTTDLTCFENSTGAIEVEADGGTTPYEYSFDGGITFSPSPSTTFIAAGTYDIVVRDRNNCQETETVIINEPDALQFDNITTFDPACFDACDGAITLDVSGGTMPYTYNWIDEDIDDDVNNPNDLCGGDYSFEVIDANECKIFDQAALYSPPINEIDSVVIVEPTCFGECDGSITVHSSDGVQFSIDGGNSFQASNNFPNLCVGDYEIVVQNNDACEIDTIATLNEPEILDLDINLQAEILCFGKDQRLEAFGQGGTLPYTYNWSNGDTRNFTFVSPATDTYYTVSVTDANGCETALDSVLVEVHPEFTATFTPGSSVCIGEEFIVGMEGFGGLPEYEYFWEHDESTTQTISESIDTASVFVAVIKDQCGAELRDTIRFEIYDAIEASFESDSYEGCPPHQVNITNLTDQDDIGGSCIWYVDGVTYVGCDGFSHVFNEKGCYDVALEMQTSNGCSFEMDVEDFICIKGDPVASFNYSPQTLTEIDNFVNFNNTSIDAVSYSWDFGNYGGTSQENPSLIFTGVDGGEDVNVCLTATSEFGCDHQVCELIHFEPEFVMHVPNAFTPASGDFNRVFAPVFPPTADIKEFSLLIFNRWGEVLFESQNQNVGWDGTYGGKMVQDGVYVWKIFLIEGDELTEHEKIGHVTLLK